MHVRPERNGGSYQCRWNPAKLARHHGLPSSQLPAKIPVDRPTIRLAQASPSRSSTPKCGAVRNKLNTMMMDSSVQKQILAKGTSVIPSLVQCLKDENSSYVRMNAAILLGEFKTAAKSAAVVLAKHMKDFDGDVSAAAVRALGLIGATQYEPQILRLVKHEQYAVKLAALESLILLKSGRVERILIDLAKNKSTGKSIREFSIKRLGSMKSKKAVQVLIKIMRGDKFRDNAVKALGRIGDRSAVPAIIEVLRRAGRDFDGQFFRRAAIGALGLLGDARAVPVLVDCLKNDMWTDGDAEKALSRIKHERAKAALKAYRWVGFVPHWFLGMGIGFGMTGNILNALTRGGRHIPPHPEDFGKYDSVYTDPIPRSNIWGDHMSFFVELGYKFKSYFGLKYRISVNPNIFSLYEGREIISSGYPPPIRQRYASGQDAYTYIMPKHSVSNSFLIDLSYTYYVKKKDFFPILGLGIEFGPSVNITAYEYGWDRYAAIEKGGIRHGGGFGFLFGAYVRLGLAFGVSAEVLTNGRYSVFGYVGGPFIFGRKNLLNDIK